MMVVKDHSTGIITSKAKLDKGKSKTLLNKLDDLDAASAGLRDSLNAAMGKGAKSDA